MRRVRETCGCCYGTGKERIDVYFSDTKYKDVVCWVCAGTGMVTVRPDYLQEVIEEVGAE